MTTDANSEMLTASEVTVKGARKELGKTLDYSIDSFKDLEALIQHVKSHLLDLKKEGKLTEQTVQRASVSLGAYLGEIIRRHHGGSWIAKNTVLKTLRINGQEFSPIVYIFQRLIKDSDYSIENYWSDIRKKLFPPEKSDSKPPISDAPKEKGNTLTGNRSLIVAGIISVVVLGCIGVFAFLMSSNPTRIPPTPTPRPTATRIPATSTPALITRDPLNYLQNLPNGYAINDSIKSKDITLDDGTRAFDIGLINRQAFNHGDVVSVQYFITLYKSESKAVSGYYKYLLGLEAEETGVLDSEIKIEGADASAVYISPEENNLARVQYISRVKNVMVTTIGLTVYDPQNVTDSFLQGLMADVAELHLLGIDNTQ